MEMLEMSEGEARMKLEHWVTFCKKKESDYEDGRNKVQIKNDNKKLNSTYLEIDGERIMVDELNIKKSLKLFSRYCFSALFNREEQISFIYNPNKIFVELAIKQEYMTKQLLEKTKCFVNYLAFMLNLEDDSEDKMYFCYDCKFDTKLKIYFFKMFRKSPSLLKNISLCYKNYQDNLVCKYEKEVLYEI